MTITGQQVIAEVRRIAAASPTFVYQPPVGSGGACKYVHEEDGRRTAGCLIGQALVAAGVPITELIDHDQDGGTPALSLMDRLSEVSATDSEAEWLSTVQSEQDRHEPWGEAVATADRYAAVLNASV